MEVDDTAANEPAAKEPALDLSPRDVVPTAARGKKKPWFAYGVLALVLITGGVFVVKFLTSAIDYYCNADEIDVKESCSGDRRVRVQGAVDQGSIVESADGGIQEFTVSFNGTTIPIDYENGAALPDLFQPCIPVVVEGLLRGGRVEGTNVEVKHSEEYEADNPDRVDDSKPAACSQQA